MSWIQKNFHKFQPKVSTYSNGRIALQYFILSDDNELAKMGFMEPACTATINMPDIPLREGEVIIKNYSENEGLYECMVEAGHITLPRAYVQSNFVKMPICKLLIN